MLKEIKIRKKGMKNHRGVSEMVGYVILISIGLAIASGVFIWAKYWAESFTPPKDCKEGTSIYLEEYFCDPVTGNIILTIKNNGRFNVTGVVVAVSGNPGKDPSETLMAKGPECAPVRGICYLSSPALVPGSNRNITFVNKDESGLRIISDKIESVSIQPFISQPNKRKIVCSGEIKKENLGSLSNPCQV